MEKIIELAHRGPPALGGVETAIFEVSKCFSRKGYKTEIWCSDILDSNNKKIKVLSEKKENIKILRFKSYNLHIPFLKSIYPSLLFKLLKIKDKKSVILHTRSILFHTFVALCLANFFKKVIVTLHLDSSTPPNKYLMKLLRLLSNKSNVIITADTENEKALYLKNKFNNKKVVVIPNGVNLKEIDNISLLDVKNIKKIYSLNNKFNIIYLGRLAPIKGCELLIKALPLLKSKNIKLIFAGPDFGSLKNLKKVAKELKLLNKIVFTGPLSRTDLLAILKTSDLLVHPSLGGESFGIVLIEAMACSKPIIASKTGGFSEVIVNNKNGLLFDVGNHKQLAEKINYLMNDPIKMEKFGNTGRKLVEEKYSWDKITEEYDKIIAK